MTPVGRWDWGRKTLKPMLYWHSQVRAIVSSHSDDLICGDIDLRQVVPARKRGLQTGQAQRACLQVYLSKARKPLSGSLGSNSSVAFIDRPAIIDSLEYPLLSSCGNAGCSRPGSVMHFHDSGSRTVCASSLTMPPLSLR